MCGKHRLLAIDDFIFDHEPYLNLGDFFKSVEELADDAIIEDRNSLSFTLQGDEVAAVVAESVFPRRRQQL